jgi:hypothetical protein
MLEGRELEGKIGEYGSYFFDIDDRLDVHASVTIRVDLVNELRKRTAYFNNALVQRAINMIARFTGKTTDEDEGEVAMANRDRTGASVSQQEQKSSRDEQDKGIGVSPDQSGKAVTGEDVPSNTDLKEANTEEPKRGESV